MADHPEPDLVVASEPQQAFTAVSDMAGAWLSDMKTKLAEWQAKAAEEHQARMAALPPGTCESCYGRGCETCQPTMTYADGVPYEFHDATLDNFRVEDGNRTALERARVFLDGRRDLYLTGGVGAGKTRLACSIANTWKRRGKSALFARVPMVLHQLQPGRSADELRDYESRLFHAPLLVLDDIGAERDQATDYTRRTLLMLYEERGDRGLRTIWTSNKSLPDLAAMQEDDRLASRIAGRADVVRLTTPDQRMARRGK